MVFCFFFFFFVFVFLQIIITYIVLGRYSGQNKVTLCYRPYHELSFFFLVFLEKGKVILFRSYFSFWSQ